MPKRPFSLPEWTRRAFPHSPTALSTPLLPGQQKFSPCSHGCFPFSPLLPPWSVVRPRPFSDRPLTPVSMMLPRHLTSLRALMFSTPSSSLLLAIISIKLLRSGICAAFFRLATSRYPGIASASMPGSPLQNSANSPPHRPPQLVSRCPSPISQITFLAASLFWPETDSHLF